MSADNTEHFGETFSPLYNGLPVVVRLMRGPDVLCMAYNSTSNDYQMLLAKPLELSLEHYTEPSADGGPHGEQRVRMRFSRWMPLSDSPVCLISGDFIISMAPLSDVMTNAYMEWAPRIYPERTEAESEDTTESPTTIPASSKPSDEDIIQLLRDFVPKGKAN